MIDLKSNYIQQGDVLVFQVDSIPPNTKLRKPHNGRHVLVEGETTGHAHVVTGPDLSSCEVYCGEDGTLYLSAIKQVTITHEEHKPLTIDPGTYRVGKVREVDPYEGVIRSVKD